MNKEDFLKKLKEDLHALSDEERLKGLKYYEEYFGIKKENAEEIKISTEINPNEIELELNESVDILDDIPDVRHKNWIYYNDENGLYKERVNGSGRTKLNDKISYDMKVAGDWIFYICSNGLYKTRTDGTLTLPVIHKSENVNPTILQIVNETGKWLFYISSSTDYSAQNTSLSRIRTDGKRNKSIENNIDFIACANKWIVYSRNDGGLYKININSSKKKTKLCDDKTNYIYIKRSWVYYNNLSDDEKPYKMRIDGKRRQIVE